MQLRRIFQCGVGFVFFVIVDKAKRIVQVGDLADIKRIDIAAGSGSDITTAVEVAHGHQGSGVSN